MNIPNKFNEKDDSLNESPFKLQIVQAFNQLIDCIKYQQKEINTLKYKMDRLQRYGEI